MEKYKRQDVSPIEEENERDKNYEATNPQINSEKTKNNYHIVSPKDSYITMINKRISTLSLKRKLRSDAIYMNSFIVSSDNGFFNRLTEEQEKQFFYECTKFLVNKYGKENILSAIVHKDETTPHLHFNFVPIVDGKLCSKDLFDRQKLADLQTEFHEEVGKKWGLFRGKIGSQATHLSTAEYKAKKIIEEAKATNKGSEIISKSIIDNANKIKKQAQEKLDNATLFLQNIENEKKQHELELEEIITNKEQIKSDIDIFSSKLSCMHEEVEKMTGLHNEIEKAYNEPIPVLGKRELISTLKAQNIKLKQDLKDKNKEYELKCKDSEDILKEYQELKQQEHYDTLKTNAVNEILRAYPEEFNELLLRSRAKLHPTRYNGNYNRNDKGGK